MLSYKFLFLLANVMLLKSIAANEAINSEAKDDFDMRQESGLPRDYPEQYSNDGGNVKDGQSIKGSVLSPDALNNIKAGKRKRYVDTRDYNQNMRSFGDDPEQYNNDGGNVKDGQGIKGDVISPNALNNIKAGRRKRSAGDDPEQYNNDGGNVKDGQGIKGDVLGGNFLNNVKAGKRKRYVDMSDYNQNMKRFRDDPEQYNNDGGNVQDGQSIKGDVISPNALNNIKAGKRKRYVDTRDFYQNMRSFEDEREQYNNDGGNVKDGQGIKGDVLGGNFLNNIKAGKRKRYVDMHDFNQNMKRFRDDPEQYNNDGGNVKDGQSIKGDVLSPDALNNIKAGKRKRYVDTRDFNQNMRGFEDEREQYNNDGGNVKDGQGIKGDVISPNALNNIKAGKRKRSAGDDPEQYNNDGGNVKNGQGIKGDVLGGNAGNNMKLGKRKRYVDMIEYNQNMRSYGDDPEQYSNDGGNVKDGQSIKGSVLSPDALNNIKAGKRKRSAGDDPEQYNNDGGNVKNGQGIKGDVLGGNAGNNLKMGKRKRYVDLIEYNQNMRSAGDDPEQYSNDGGNVKDGQSIKGSVLSPDALNNIKAGKR